MGKVEYGEGFHTWFVLNTNLVPLVRLSVTIIRLLSEGLHRTP